MKTALYHGSFSEVELVEDDNHRKFVTKTAREEASKGTLEGIESSAILFVTGGLMSISPDCSDLLKKQYFTLKAWQGIKGIVGLKDGDLDSEDGSSLASGPDSKSSGNGGYHYSMEYLEGATARELFVTGKFTASMYIELVEIVSAIEKQPDHNFHGDIKPENIICSPDGIKLIDPGYFGPMDTEYGREQLLPVTTPIYYPGLKPDDVLALGILLWECLLYVHPFQPVADAEEYDDSMVTKNLFAQVENKRRVGQHFLAPVLGLKRPRELRPDLSLDMEALLLKVLRLQVDENSGLLDSAQGFSSASEFASVLKAMQVGGYLQWS